MRYQIIPLEMGSIAERYIFQQKNKEIKCGRVWKLGSVITSIKPIFIENYDPNKGICIGDIPGAEISKTYGGEKVIYFSETIDEDEQDELTDIFYQSNKKFGKNYIDVFQDLGWDFLGFNTYIFGELEIKELRDNPFISKYA
jgi:methenyltetrahydromethanopterin cyclohydrolase